MKKVLLLVALSVCLLPLWGQRDFSQIDSLIKKMLPEASEVGISVYDLTAKKPLYSYRADKLSRPASTLSLIHISLYHETVDGHYRSLPS